MTISMYSATIPTLIHAMKNLQGILEKGKAHAATKGTDEANYLAMRLIPDMFPLEKQVRIACDIAERGASRLSGAEPSTHADDETSFNELIARCQSVIDHLSTFTPAQIDGSEEREIILTTPFGERHFSGQQYLLGFVLANVHFHMSMTYALLRGVGVEVGKLDYLGG